MRQIYSLKFNLSTEIYGLQSSLCGNQKTDLLFKPLDTGLVEWQKT
jgi:hypothetical protein